MGMIIQVAAACFCGCLGCCFNCCCSEISTACVGIFGKDKVVKLYYILLDLFVVIPSIFLFYYIQTWVSFSDFFQKYIKCPAPSASGGNLNCFGNSTVYRLSFALLLLYCLLLLFMLMRNRISRIINEGLFLVKYILVIGGFIGLLFVQDLTFENYAEACKYIGIVFLILQSIILIDLFYLWGINWVKKYDEGYSGYAFLLIFFTIIMYAGAIALNVLGYIKFSHSTLWVNIITTFLIVGAPLTQLLHWNIQNSLLTTSTLCLYISFLGYVAQYSNPKDPSMDTGAMVGDLSVSTFLFFLTMYGSIMGGTGVIKVSQTQSLNGGLGLSNQVKQDEKGKQPEALRAPQAPETIAEEAQYVASYQGWVWVKWQIYMIIGSMYIAMLVTNWGSSKFDASLKSPYQPSEFAFWSRIFLQWITTLLYIWTLVAPRIFPDRDFVIE